MRIQQDKTVVYYLFCDVQCIVDLGADNNEVKGLVISYG